MEAQGAQKCEDFSLEACRDILPTLHNLKTKKIVERDVFPICFREPKTTSHIPWACESAMDVWGQESRQLQKFFLSQLIPF